MIWNIIGDVICLQRLEIISVDRLEADRGVMLKICFTISKILSQRSSGLNGPEVIEIIGVCVWKQWIFCWQIRCHFMGDSGLYPMQWSSECLPEIFWCFEKYVFSPLSQFSGRIWFSPNEAVDAEHSSNRRISSSCIGGLGRGESQRILGWQGWLHRSQREWQWWQLERIG